MTSLPEALYRAADVRELDRIAIEDFGVPGIELMRRAGKAAFTAMRSRWPDAQHIVVYCGAGNNAGDGFVVAQLARQAGLQVSVVMLAEVQRLKGDALTAFNDACRAGVVCQAYNGAEPISSVDIVVDGLLGTGLQGEVSGIWREAIETINALHDSKREVKILALDIPSGLHADSGAVLGAAVHADLTVTFIGVKQGLLTANGPDCCGELVFDDLAVNPEVYHKVNTSARRLTQSELSRAVSPRKQATHKRDYGHLLIIGGNYSMPGALRMASEAALRVGAGLVSVATRAEHAALLTINRPEIMAHGIRDARELIRLLTRVTHVAIGPGLGQDAWAQALLSAVLQCDLPMVVDADALNMLAREPQKNSNWVLTPHPGEASRLLNTSTHAVQQDRFSVIQQLQHTYGGCCVLKGAGSLTIDTQGRIALCNAGNAYMAGGGMGDVLTGVIAGLMAQGASLDAAMNAGVWLHAFAADRVVSTQGGHGLLATDLIAEIRGLINTWLANKPFT